jgi:hypothetical protein
MKSPGVMIGTLAVAMSLAMSLVACGSSSTPARSDAAVSSSDGGEAGASRASLVASNGYITAGPWAGYGFTATDPGAATIVPDCSGAAGCTPAFAGSDFCMQGTVTGRADYTGFAMLGWNVNQVTTDGSAMDTWPVPASGGVTITVIDDPPSTALRVQLQGTDPHDSADRWCAPLVSGQPIAWSDFKTNCYAGGTPQNPLTAGTMIQQASVLVPGLLTDLPFDVCLIDIQIQP